MGTTSFNPLGETPVDPSTVTIKPVIAPTYPFLYRLGEEVIHIKTQGFYAIDGLPDINRLSETGEPCYAYISKETGLRWHRSQTQMEDGRYHSLNPF